MELVLASGCRNGPPAYVNTVKKGKKIVLKGSGAKSYMTNRLPSPYMTKYFCISS